ncbi:MAG: ATP-binding cassette domain-containing protein [Paracoccaceae bacterium]|nr:ATP-binding cassette domain-containing protein [Paracoccaceae bacterium]
MNPLWRLALRLTRAEPRAFGRGLALSALVLVMGAALLGLSGWFVTAAAAAGIAGIGVGFDFFRPSAGVRFLALGRSAARYGERLLTHDATLRALAALRGALLGGIARLPHEAQARLRGARALNRLTADVDALDGLMLRLVLPALAALGTHLAAFVALWLLVAPGVAGAVLAIYALGGGAVLWATARAAHPPAEAAETALQSLRAQSLDLLRTRADLTLAGALLAARDRAMGQAETDRAARATLDRIDRAGASASALTTSLAAAAALGVGGQLAMAGTISPARAAIGFFTALALGETLGLLRRGLAELGRMQAASARVLALADTPAVPEPATAPMPLPGPLLQVSRLTYHRAGAECAVFGPLDLTLNRGETVLLSGPSGAGKSTALACIAGLLPPSTGQIAMQGHPLGDWPEADLRAALTLVPQRPALIGGTVAQNLALALPEGAALDPDAAWAVLRAVDLEDAIRARGGLQMALGEGGSGLSGGQSKRLALARAMLRRPAVLILDEPTEGLDPATAAATLAGIRAALSDSGLLIVSHRAADLPFAHRHLALEHGT